MSDLLEQDDLTHALRSARGDECRLWLARRLVAQREAAGKYAAVIQGPLTEDMRELLAVVLLRELGR